ncbi:conserved hypothetical protein, partial [Ricinus communis]
ALRGRRDAAHLHDGGVGRGHALEVRAPQRLGTRFQEQQQPDGGDLGMQGRGLAQRMEDQPLADDAQHRHRDGCGQHGRPVAPAPGHHGLEGHEGADHVETAVREIGHVQDAVDQGQAQGHQAVDAAQGQA